MPATLETPPIVMEPSIGEWEAGGFGAAAATIPVLALAIHIAGRNFGGGGLSPDAPLSVRAAFIVALSAPLLLPTVTVAVSLAARRFGVRIGTSAPLRLRPTAIALAAAAALSFSLLAAPSVVAFTFAMLAMSLLGAVGSIFSAPAMSFGIWASAVIVGVSVVTSIATTQRRIEKREIYSPYSIANALLLLPCIVTPLLILWNASSPPGPFRPARWETEFATPVMSIAFFGSAFLIARLRRSTDAFSRLRLAGRCMFFYAAELSLVANVLGLGNLC